VIFEEKIEGRKINVKNVKSIKIKEKINYKGGKN